MNMENDKLVSELIDQGAKLNIGLDELRERLLKIKGVVFDWDGVFNDGIKKVEASSGYSETDSMGTNMLRFAFSFFDVDLKTAIITGAGSPSSFKFAQRECFDFVFWKSKDKAETLKAFMQETGLEAEQILFMGDDIIDLEVASMTGVSIQIRRKNNVFFNDFVDRKGLFQYTTSVPGGSHAVREACDLLIYALGVFDEVVENRMHCSERYLTYLQQRNDRETVIKPPLP